MNIENHVGALLKITKDEKNHSLKHDFLSSSHDEKYETGFSSNIHFFYSSFDIKEEIPKWDKNFLFALTYLYSIHEKHQDGSNCSLGKAVGKFDDSKNTIENRTILFFKRLENCLGENNEDINERFSKCKDYFKLISNKGIYLNWFILADDLYKFLNGKEWEIKRVYEKWIFEFYKNKRNKARKGD